MKRLLPLLPLLLFPHLAAAAPACQQPGLWLRPLAGEGAVLTTGAVLDELAGQAVVLLGERHDNAEDHRWQVQTLAQLHARRPALAIGFEMFPRRLQGVLDDWVAGRLSEAEFLRRVDWNRVWSFDARDYLPLFHYARMHRLPMLALNVERALVDRVGAQGWEGIAATEREGIGRPAAPTAAYRAELRQVFDHHAGKAGDAAFQRFVEAQGVWDRAMAEGIADHLKGHPDTLVVGIVGRGHSLQGHGIPWQLADLGIQRVAYPLPWEVGSCADLSPGLATAVFLIQPPADAPPRLGIAMEQAGDVTRVATVTADGVAARAGLLAGDVLLEVAGRPVRSPGDVRLAIQRQAPGTWLPIRLRRGVLEMEVVARFPAEP